MHILSPISIPISCTKGSLIGPLDHMSYMSQDQNDKWPKSQLDAVVNLRQDERGDELSCSRAREVFPDLSNTTEMEVGRVTRFGDLLAHGEILIGP